MKTKTIIILLLGLIFVVFMVKLVTGQEKNQEKTDTVTEKKVIGFIKELDENELIVDDGMYIYAFNDPEKSEILLVDPTMQAEKVGLEILKEYAKLEQKIEVNYLQKEHETEAMEIIISLNKAWTGKLEAIDLENKTLSLQGDNKILVFANDKVKGTDLKPGDEITIWVNYDRFLKKFIIDKIQ